MTLLAAITNPAAGSLPISSERAHPIVLTPCATPPPPTSSALPTPIPPSVWSLSPADPTAATAAASLASSLHSCPSLPRLRTLLTNFIATLSQSLALPTPPTSSSLPAAIRAVAPYFPAAIASLVASKAASLADGHDVVLALAESRLLRHPPPELLSTLCDDDGGRADLVCAVLRHAADIRSSEILAVLRCFLSPASDKAYDAMVGVKGRWKDAAVLAVNRCREKKRKKADVDAAARRAALLLMMGHDGFTSPEVCLHYLFASGNVDSVVLGAAVAQLDGGEVVRLMRYLNKWIAKYRRFSEAQTCSEEAVENLGFEQCDSVPSFGAVARALGVLLDNHFSHLVLNADVREDLRAAELMVRELAAEAESSGPILDLLHRLQLDK